VLDIADELTDRQLAVLRAAYQAGFFEWPRDASGEEVAESLDIAAPTFHQHLRKAEKAIIAVFLSTIDT
jgi:predicted DNA binding protein